MVKVYVTDVSNLPDPKDNPEILNGLPEERVHKIMKYRQIKDRKHSLGAGLLLKECLKEYGINIEEIRYGEHGKPEVDGIYFNISHSYDRVVCVVGEKMVGCDIEKIANVKEGIAERFFTENEFCYLEQFHGDKKRDEFYRLWTMKESYMKMTGEGMSLSLKRFEFEISNNVKVYRDGKKCDCNIKEYEIPGYKLTVCAQEEIFAENLTEVSLKEKGADFGEK